jgi:hypothetical protein
MNTLHICTLQSHYKCLVREISIFFLNHEFLHDIFTFQIEMLIQALNFNNFRLKFSKNLIQGPCQLRFQVCPWCY